MSRGTALGTLHEVTILLLALGVSLLVIVTIDQVATILATGRTSGAVIPRITVGLWRVALASHHRWPSHRRLSVVGILLLAAAPALWAAGLWLGWTLVFASSESSTVDADRDAPGSLAAQAYVAGFSLFTLGVGDVEPGGDGWRLAAVVASVMGLAMITLGISYLIPVIDAATERRHLARLLRQLGRTPDELLAQPDLLLDELTSLRTTIALVTEQHLTHHVLRYHHAPEPSLSLPLRTAVVWTALERLAAEQARHGQPDPRLPLVQRAVAELGRATMERDDVADEDLVVGLLTSDGHRATALDP